MAKLIFLAGLMGAGKSSVARAHAERTYYVHGDGVQKAATLKAFPFLKKGHEYSWTAWPREAERTMHMVPLLAMALDSVHSDLDDKQRELNIMCDGSLFVADWFRTPFIEALGVTGHRYAAHDIHLIYLCPPPEVVFQQILHRADTDPHRAKERTRFKNVEALAKDWRGYDGNVQRSEGAWQRYETIDASTAEVGRLLDEVAPAD